jgi:hypothetical protein
MQLGSWFTHCIREVQHKLFPKIWSGFNLTFCIWGWKGSVVVKALCYKPEGRRFDTR